VVLALGLVACGTKETTPEPAATAPTCAPSPPAITGTATHYDADGSGKCSFDAGDRMVAAISGARWEGAGWCGACAVVIGPRDEILVRIVDSCPGCKPDDLDLSREAFALLAPLQRGRIPITWLPVPCPVEGALAYRFKDGSNAHWAAIQVRNHRYPIASVEARKKDGTFKQLERAAYNYFIGKALGAGPYTLRITDTRGNTVEDSGIALGESVVRNGTAQLARCQ
jgi:expansin (peptidoglycan-binding protein)